MTDTKVVEMTYHNNLSDENRERGEAIFSLLMINNDLGDKLARDEIDDAMVVWAEEPAIHIVPFLRQNSDKTLITVHSEEGLNNVSIGLLSGGEELPVLPLEEVFNWSLQDYVDNNDLRYV